MLIIGSHVSYQGGMTSAVKEALNNDANTFMFYTGAPTNTFRSSIKESDTNEAKKLMLENNIDINNVIVHAPYIINLANTESLDKWQFGISFIISEINRCQELGVTKLVLHPGNHLHQTKEEGINNLAEALNIIISKTNNVTILIETMAGKGSEIASSLEEIKGVINLIENKTRIGVCVDTCHINDAGYNIIAFDEYLQQFDKLIGIKYFKCLHLNDTKNAVGTHKDRHANIGLGTIGFDNILKIVYNPMLNNIPIILETPYINDKSPYKIEINMIKNKKFDETLLSL